VNGRIGRLRAALDGLGAGTFLVSNPVDIFYLTGFESSNAILIVDGDQLRVLTDYRYMQAARELDGAEVIQGERDLASWLGNHLSDLAEGPVAFDANTVTVAALEGLAADGAELVPTRWVVLNLRAVKEAEELEAIRSSAEVLHGAYEALAEHGLVGRTERELAWFMERTMREAGAEALAFDTIVGGGPNGALPHHHPGGRKIERGELVIVDTGARVGGYCSDCTRTFSTGELPDDLAQAYETTKEAQAKALAAVRPGAPTREIHEIANQVIEGSGREHLQHGLGHGVGLEVHESPVLRKDSEGELQPGNVVTVEPGIYLAGRGGVRIEDLVIVTDEGPEVLTPFTKDLLALD